MRIGMVINVNISTKLPFVNHNVKTSTRLGHPLWAGFPLYLLPKDAAALPDA